MSKVFGIDISKYQKGMNLTTATPSHGFWQFGGETYDLGHNFKKLRGE